MVDEYDGLRVAGLTKSFGALTAVQDMSLVVGGGEVHGVIGPNGAGKSTLLNMIAGVTVADRGEVLLDGVRMTGRDAGARANLGIFRTFQHPRLINALTVLENVMLGADLTVRRRGSGRREQVLAARAAAALEEVGVPSADWLKPAGDIPPTSHRWLEIARLFAAAPRVALFDEPNSGFTSAETQRLVGVLNTLRAKETCVVVVTHDVSLAMHACTRICVMHRGAHLMTGTPAEVIASPEAVASYLGERAAALARRVLAGERG